MLYSCIADINKNEYVLVESNRVNKLFLSDERSDRFILTDILRGRSLHWSGL